MITRGVGGVVHPAEEHGGRQGGEVLLETAVLEIGWNEADLRIEGERVRIVALKGTIGP